VAALAKIELVPAPAAGQKLYLRADEIRDLLARRGVSLVNHKLSGASQVVVTGPSRPVVQRERRTSVSAPVRNRAMRRTQEALQRHLRDQSARDDLFQFQFQLDDQYAVALSRADAILTVSGGNAPWTGQQRFTVSLTHDGETMQVPVKAYVSLSEQVVVVTRRLPQGSIVRRSDVELQFPNAGTRRRTRSIQSLEEVVGMQTTRGLSEGQVVETTMVERPVLVQRGQVVTVYSRTAGVQVRLEAVARQTGSLGDVIRVETLDQREPFIARVSGFQEVEVYARAVDASHVGGADFARLGQQQRQNRSRSSIR